MMITSELGDGFFCVISAVGCPDIVPKQEVSVKRVGSNAVVKCNHTDVTFFLSCEGTQWNGEIGNCTKGKENCANSFFKCI